MSIEGGEDVGQIGVVKHKSLSPLVSKGVIGAYIDIVAAESIQETNYIEPKILECIQTSTSPFEEIALHRDVLSKLDRALGERPALVEAFGTKKPHSPRSAENLVDGPLVRSGFLIEILAAVALSVPEVEIAVDKVVVHRVRTVERRGRDG
jgi:hypothetical protein